MAYSYVRVSVQQKQILVYDKWDTSQNNVIMAAVLSSFFNLAAEGEKQLRTIHWFV